MATWIGKIMTVKYTIELTDVEVKALGYVAYDQQTWINNAVKVRCNRAIDEIYKLEVDRMVADPNITEIPADKNTIVMNADIKSAKELTDAGPPPLENMP